VDAVETIEQAVGSSSSATSATSWTQSEEALIAETMLERGVPRITAIQFLRRYGQIGETRIPVTSTGIFSGDVCYGLREIDAHFTAGKILAPNVSKAADHAFLKELERNDPNRYERLLKSTYRCYRLAQESAQDDRPRCQHCELVLPDNIRDGARFCDRSCKQAAYRARKAA
jgi:hypothetical protein